jgi:ketosteroid isomerase-like protein
VAASATMPSRRVRGAGDEVDIAAERRVREMAVEIETVLRSAYEAFDRKDFTAALEYVTADVQAVDELTRHWIRGRAELADILRETAETMDGFRTEIGDVRETVLGDVGWITCWIEQDYTMDGQHHHVAAPTSVMFRRAVSGGCACSTRWLCPIDRMRPALEPIPITWHGVGSASAG